MKAMDQLFNHKISRALRFALLITLSVSVAAVIYIRQAEAKDQDLQKLNRFVQGQRVNTAAMQIFREGRDQIEAQNWQKAAEKFKDFISGYPRDKDIDAALYWYGYALQKQGLKDEARVPLKKLINNYPNSTWRREAEAMLAMLGFQADVQVVLDKDNCEIKILALQSLFQADEDRAISIVTEALKANPSPCPSFQAAAISLAGSHGGPKVVPLLLNIARSNSDLRLRLTAIKRLGEQHNEAVSDELIKLYDTDKTKEVRLQILRALIESRTARGSAKVLEIARTSDDVAMRQTAIRYLGDLKDPASLDELLRLYDADKTLAIRAQILRALAERDDPRAHAKILEVAKTGETPELRIEAIRRLGDRGKISIDELLQLYTTETNLNIKQGLLRAFSDVNDPRTLDKLRQVAASNEAIELRAYAIRQLGNRDDEATVTQLIGLYGSEQNVQVRAALLRAFGDSKQKVAVRKLIEIARTDPSVELRKTAVRYLGESKDPEALKALEDLLK
jgi:HEAT repeat protein